MKEKMEMKMKGNEREIKMKENGKGNGEWKGKLSDPSPFNNILNNIQFLLAVIKHSYF